MASIDTKKNKQNYNMNASQYVELKWFIQNRTATIKGGVMYVFHEGKWIKDEEFKKMFPLPERLYMCVDNPDKTRLY
jgi:hypothetical protein